jgi:hypothetical protein
MNDFIARIGTFFFVLGFGLFVLFLASDLANMVQFDYLCLAMLSIGLGWMLHRRKAPPPSAGRFSWVKKTRETMRKRRMEPGKSKEEKPAPKAQSEEE